MFRDVTRNRDLSCSHTVQRNNQQHLSPEAARAVLQAIAGLLGPPTVLLGLGLHF
jgi:hypothetical protein